MQITLGSWYMADEAVAHTDPEGVLSSLRQCASLSRVDILIHPGVPWHRLHARRLPPSLCCQQQPRAPAMHQPASHACPELVTQTAVCRCVNDTAVLIPPPD